MARLVGSDVEVAEGLLQQKGWLEEFYRCQNRERDVYIFIFHPPSVLVRGKPTDSIRARGQNVF